MKLYVQVDGSGDWLDYTQYIVDGSLVIEDAINVPTLTTFSLVANDGKFQLPPRGSYIKIASEIYGASGGYLQPGQAPVTTGKVLATGFVSNEPERSYLGLNKQLTQTGFQQLNYQFNVTSDEWLLNTSMVPYIPAFVDQTQGQILARLAEALCPDFGFDVTSFVASGDVVPYYQYDPQQTWSDIAKTFADSSRYRYKVINKTIYFLPFGDRPLGVEYDETGPEKTFFPLDMKTGVLTVPPVNDALVLGDEEPQAKWDNYFVGDGFTTNFKLRHTMFHGTSTLLLSDDWTEADFQTNLWNVQDPFGVFSLPGALNVNQKGLSGTLNQTYILCNNGVELGGVIELQHGEFQFTDYNLGIVGGVYSDPANLTLANCIAGFVLTGQPGASGIAVSGIEIDGGNIVNVIVRQDPTAQYRSGSAIRLTGLTHATFLNYDGTNTTKLSIQSISGPFLVGGVQQWTVTCISIPDYASYPPTPDTGTLVAFANDVLLTASGAAGVAIYPILNGAIAGQMLALSQPDHHYQLETRFGASNWTRYQAAYRNFNGQIQYGGLQLEATANVTFICSDINLDLVVATQYNNFVFNGGVVGPPVPVLPTVTQQSVTGVGVPSFAVYAIINSQDLNLALNFTQISYPPQGSLAVASLSGASATQLPVYPSVALAPPGTPASQILGPVIDYSLGFGLSLPTATISQTGNTSYLSFFTDTIPGVGSRIRFVSWASGQAIARVRNSASVTQEARVSGDTGLRSAILTNLSPAPRTSDECELAAAAAITDQAYPQYQGTYTVFTIPFRYETVLDPALADYPRTGRYLLVNSPARGITLDQGLAAAQTPVLVEALQGGTTELTDPSLLTLVQELGAGDYIFVMAFVEGGDIIGSRSGPPVISNSMGLTFIPMYVDVYVGMWYAVAGAVTSPGSVQIFWPDAHYSRDLQVAHYSNISSMRVAAASGLTPTQPNVVVDGYDIGVNAAPGVPSGKPWAMAVGLVPVSALVPKDMFVVGLVAAPYNAIFAGGYPQPWTDVTYDGFGHAGAILQWNALAFTPQFLVTTIRSQIIELRQEVLQVELSYGPDQYLEKLLANFIQRPEPGILGPQESAIPPTPVELTEAGSFYLPMFASGSVTAIRNSLAANYIDVDLGQIPVSAAEVRRVDAGWGLNDNNLIGLFTTQKFSLPRTSRDQTWYIRPRYAGRTSRFSYIIRVNVPMIPSPPALLSSNSQTLVFDFAGFVGDIYGLELRATPVTGAYEFVQFPNVPEDTFAQMLRSKLLVPTDAAAGGKPVVNNSNVAAVYNPPSNATAFPFAEEFQLGDVIYVVSPNDASFQGIHLATNILTEQGSVGPGLPPNLAFANAEAFFFVNNSTCNGAFCYSSAVFPPAAATEPFNNVQFIRPLSSLEMNYGPGVNWAVDPNTQPALFNEYDNAGNLLGTTSLSLGGLSNQAWAMAITGVLIVPASGAYTLNMPHDDGAFIGIKGPGVTFSGTPPTNIAAAIIAHGTCILGIPIMGGTNESGYHPDDTWVVTFATPGNYEFEINYAQWYNEQTLALLHNGGSIFPGNLASPAVTGAPWGIGWFDYGEPYVDQIGNAVYGVASEVATCQLYNRGGSVVAASGSIQAGNTGLCTIGTVTPHGFTQGQPIIIGCSWQTFPLAGYPALPNSGSVFTGLQTVSNVVDANHFQFVSARLTAPTTAWEIAAASLGVPTQLLNGLVAPLPTPFSFNLAASSGVILQRPIFSPSDLTVDLTSPDIAETLGILEALSPNGRIAGLEARFFNLTWDYSVPTPIPNFSVPAITGVFIDDATQQVSWNLASGLPTGYRIDITDPATNQLYNQFTIDHPYNPLLLTQFQMSNIDFSTARNITITPFDAIGDGIPITIFHSGNGAIAGGAGAYRIYQKENGVIQPNQILVRVPFDQTVIFAMNMVPSQAWIDVPPVSGSTPPASGLMVFSIQRFSYSDGSQDVGVEFACLTFSPGTHIGVYTSSTAQPFNQGDVLKIIAQNVPGDGVGIGLTLVGTPQ